MNYRTFLESCLTCCCSSRSRGCLRIAVRCQQPVGTLRGITCYWWRFLPPPLCWENHADVYSPLQRFGHFCVCRNTLYLAVIWLHILPGFTTSMILNIFSSCSMSFLLPLKLVLSSSEACIITSNWPLLSHSQLQVSSFGCCISKAFYFSVWDN